MEEKELLKKLQEDLKAIGPDKNSREIQMLIQSITRSVNRLARPQEKAALILKQLCVDLMQSLSAEQQFNNLHDDRSLGIRPNKLKISDGFFKSVEILRQEFFSALQKLSDPK